MRLAPLLLLVLPSAVLAQCGMTTYVGVINGCHVVPQVSVYTNGGTPPYTIAIEKRNALTQVYSNYATVTGDADGAYVSVGNVSDWDNTDHARVTVTDATSCVATWTEAFGSFVHFLPVSTVVVDCNAEQARIRILHTTVFQRRPVLYRRWRTAGFLGSLGPGRHFHLAVFRCVVGPAPLLTHVGYALLGCWRLTHLLL